MADFVVDETRVHWVNRPRDAPFGAPTRVLRRAKNGGPANAAHGQSSHPSPGRRDEFLLPRPNCIATVAALCRVAAHPMEERLAKKRPPADDRICVAGLQRRGRLASGFASSSIASRTGCNRRGAVDARG